MCVPGPTFDVAVPLVALVSKSSRHAPPLLETLAQALVFPKAMLLPLASLPWRFIALDEGTHNYCFSPSPTNLGHLELSHMPYK